MNIRLRGLAWGIILLFTCMTGVVAAKEDKITVMNPRGIMPPIRLPKF